MRYIFLLLLIYPGCNNIEPVDIILYNGKIITLDEKSSIAEAIAIKGQSIYAVGKNEVIRQLRADEVLDLKGKTVVPGFTDNHYHRIGGGPGVDLSRVRSFSELISAIASRASKTAPGKIVITNSDWHEGQLKEQTLPYRDDLDTATTEHPVVVVRGGHELILNTFALEKWGIDELTKAPEGGSIGRYPDGRLNGELVDAAKRLVKLPTENQSSNQLSNLPQELKSLNEVGLTSIRYGSASPELYSELKNLHKRGELPLRVSVLLRVPRNKPPEQVLETLRSWDIHPKEGNSWLRVDGIKLGVDGGFEGGLMRDPYEEPWGKEGTFYGLQTMETNHFHEIVRALNREGWRIGTHAVGDAAIDLVLDAYESANEESSIVGKRWTIEHGFIPRPDQFPRMSKLGVHITAQHHLYVAAPSLIQYWGLERAQWVTPLRAYIDASIPVSLGTDTPVIPYPPLWVLYHFITRDTISAGIMGTKFKISREEALRAMSIGYAKLTFQEEVQGTLEPTKNADLVVLSNDILSCEPSTIRDMDVLMTMVGGKFVFNK